MRPALSVTSRGPATTREVKVLVTGGAGVGLGGDFFTGTREAAALGATGFRTSAAFLVDRALDAPAFVDRALDAALVFVAFVAFFGFFGDCEDVDEVVFVVVLVVHVVGVDEATARECAVDVTDAVPLALAGSPTRRVAERVRGRTARPHVSAARRRSMWQAAFRGRYGNGNRSS